MIGLLTTRVVVIDDNPEEAMAVMRALQSLQISALHFDGSVESLPDSPIDGIRLVFLDIRLGGAAGEPHHYVTQTVQVLRTAVKGQSGITGIVFWTAHPEDIDTLKHVMTAELPDFKPAFSLFLGNKTALTANPQELKNKILETLTLTHGCRLLWEWEQAAHDAATATTTLLVNVASQSGGAGTLDQKLIWLLASLAKASGAGGKGEPNEEMARLFETLNQLHFDDLEVRALSGRVAGPHTIELQKQLATGAKPDEIQKSIINGALMVADIPLPSHPAPGNVYIESGWKSDRGEFPLAGKEVLENLVDEIYSGYKSKKALLENLRKTSVPCLLEITPACDYAESKSGLARLLGGLLVSVADAKLPAQARTFARETPFLLLKQGILPTEEAYRLVTNARCLHTMPLAELVVHRPAFRLRSQLVTDIRAWFASHAARPGHTSV